MADDPKGVIQAASDGGVSGEHAEAKPFEFLVGPTTTDQFNTARLRLIPIACWRVDDIRFAFDSSFVNADPEPDNPNDIRSELKHLVDLVKAHPGAPLSVFGHADPVGSDDYNKLLSGRRAMTIYGLLIAQGDSGTAVKLWQQVAATEHWGKDQRQIMEQVTGSASGAPINALIQSYLQKLCPPELKLTKTDFLAQGADSDGKGDYQGCGEFNPILLFSKEKQDRFDKAQSRNSKEDKPILEERNAANAPNRRVMVLMFRKGSKVDPKKWPCPSATQGVAGCKKRFWGGGPEGEKRRSTHLPGTDRRFDKAGDTFACRFYQRISGSSPCDTPVTKVPLVLRLFDPFTVRISDAPYRITVGGEIFDKQANPDGFVNLQVAAIPEDCLVEWGHNDDDTQIFLFSRKIYLQLEGLEEEDEEVKRRLHNLGYSYENALKENIKAFQLDYGLSQTTDVKSVLRQWYDDTTQIQKRPEANASQQ